MMQRGATEPRLRAAATLDRACARCDSPTSCVCLDDNSLTYSNLLGWLAAIEFELAPTVGGADVVIPRVLCDPARSPLAARGLCLCPCSYRRSLYAAYTEHPFMFTASALRATEQTLRYIDAVLGQFDWQCMCRFDHEPLTMPTLEAWWSRWYSRYMLAALTTGNYARSTGFFLPRPLTLKAEEYCRAREAAARAERRDKVDFCY